MIQNDNYEHVIQRICQHPTLSELAETLRETLPEPDEDTASVDTDVNRFSSESASGLMGQSASQRRRVLSADTFSPTDTFSSDSMEMDPNPIDNGDMRLYQYFEHYQRTMIELFNGTDQEAEDLLRQLRSPNGRHNFDNLQLPTRQESQSTYGGTRTLPEIPTSIRSNSMSTTPRQRMWISPREVDSSTASRLPYSARPLYSPETSPTTPSVNVWSLPATP